MKIAVDARSLLTRSPRGEGRTLRDLYRHIAALRPDWRITLYGEEPYQTHVDRSNIRSATLNVPGYRFNLWENFGLPLAAKLSGSDLIHAASTTAPRAPLLPLVVTVHDIIPVVFDDGQSQPAVDRFRKQLTFGLRKAKVIIAVSAHTRDDLVRHFFVDPSKIQVIHWGIDRPRVIERASWPLSEQLASTPYFLAFGGNARRKNTATIIQAYSRLARGSPPLVLVGLGDTGIRARYDELATHLGCKDRIITLPYIDDAHLDSLLTRALALVYVSLYEGFGMPLLEAMVRGVPVIASNTTSIPEIVGGAALLVDPSDAGAIAHAMENIIEDPAARESLALRGLTRAEGFKWEDTAGKTVAAFETAMSHHRSTT
jgi:glycosyltransferase involved in cell wall biosynthesis